MFLEMALAMRYPTGMLPIVTGSLRESWIFSHNAGLLGGGMLGGGGGKFNMIPMGCHTWLLNAAPLCAAYHVAHSFCEVPASREAQVDTQLLRRIQAGHLLSDSRPHATILIAGRCGRLRKLFDRFALFPIL